MLQFHSALTWPRSARTQRRRTTIAVATVALTMLTASYAPAAQADGYYKVLASPSLNVRSGPSSSSAVLASKPYGSTIHVYCQTRFGSSVNGSTYWDFLGFDRSGRQYWVSDYWTSTPVYNGYSPGLGQCSTLNPFWTY